MRLDFMDNREYPSRGGRETVAAQRNNTLPDIRRSYRRCTAAVVAVAARSGATGG